jgi:hypothetical protein
MYFRRKILLYETTPWGKHVFSKVKNISTKNCSWNNWGQTSPIGKWILKKQDFIFLLSYNMCLNTHKYGTESFLKIAKNGKNRNCDIFAGFKNSPKKR